MINIEIKIKNTKKELETRGNIESFNPFWILSKSFVNLLSNCPEPLDLK